MRVLVDMDGVLADSDGAFYREWKERYPQIDCVPFEKRTKFYAEEEFPEDLRGIVREIWDRPYFYSYLEPIKGGREALEGIKRLGHEVFICTSPSISNYMGCILGKFMWIERYFGDEWLRRIILTKDKTVVRGDILIDDKPEIRGVMEPVWEHVLYDQPYNQEVNGKRRIIWENWRELFEN